MQETFAPSAAHLHQPGHRSVSLWFSGLKKHRDENCGDYCVSLFKTVCFLFISLKYPGKERDREREIGRERDRDREMSL
jgi:hypothetical protein